MQPLHHPPRLWFVYSPARQSRFELTIGIPPGFEPPAPPEWPPPASSHVDEGRMFGWLCESSKRQPQEIPRMRTVLSDVQGAASVGQMSDNEVIRQIARLVAEGVLELVPAEYPMYDSVRVEPPPPPPPPPPPGPPPPPRVEKKKSTEPSCVLSRVTYQCSHDSRSVMVDLPSADKEKGGNILYVVAASHSVRTVDVIEAVPRWAAPVCDKHRERRFVLQGSGLYTQLDDTHIEVGYQEHVELSYKRIWPWSTPYKQVFITPQACRNLEGPLGLEVRVLPAMKAGAHALFQLDAGPTAEHVYGRMRKRGYIDKHGPPPDTEWRMEFSAWVYYGMKKLAFELSVDEKKTKFRWLNLVVKRAIDWLCERFHTIFGVSIYPALPNVRLQYSGEFKEIDKSPMADSEYSFTLKADPLIGITASLDVFDVMISALKKTQFAPLGFGLQKIRDLAEKYDQTVALGLSATGAISGEAGLKKNAGETDVGATGSIGGGITFELGLECGLGSTGVIGIGVGAEGKGSVGFKAALELGHDNKGVLLTGKLGMDDLKFEYAFWITCKAFVSFSAKKGDDFILIKEKSFLEGPIHAFKAA